MIAIAINVDVTQLHLQALESFADGGPGFDSLMRIASSSMLGAMRTRIHEQGKAADGQDIGQYSTKPLYVNPNSSPRSFSTVGKTGETKFKRGKKKGQPHATRYFETGYSGFKTAIGRNQLGHVNLSLTGQLNNQFTLIGVPNGYGLGWADAEKANRAVALEEKYRKKIWDLTDTERSQLVDVVHYELDKILNA